MGLRRIGVSVAKLIMPLTIAMLPGMAVAQQNSYSEPNKTVQFVGVQGNSGYVSFTTPMTAGCAYDNVYFDITTDAGKAELSVILTARASNRPLGRVDYTVSSGLCYVAIVQL